MTPTLVPTRSPCTPSYATWDRSMQLTIVSPELSSSQKNVVMHLICWCTLFSASFLGLWMSAIACFVTSSPWSLHG